MLGGLDGCFAAGELDQIPPVPDQGTLPCSCGAYLLDCPCWGPVLRIWNARYGTKLESDWRSIQEKFARYRHLPRIMSSQFVRGHMHARWLRVHRTLHDSIAEVTDAAWVIDSSKRLGRAMAVASDPQACFIHLRRDPRGVVASLMEPIARNQSEGVARSLSGMTLNEAIKAWLQAERRVQRIARFIGSERLIQLDFDQLLAEPNATLKVLSKFIGTQAPAADKTCREINMSHVASGNRLRIQKSLMLDQVDRGALSLSKSDQDRVWIRCGRMAT